MIKQVTSKRNLNAAYLQVYRNKGAAGVDEMSIMELHSHLHRHSKRYIHQIEQGSYQISPILGVELSAVNHDTIKIIKEKSKYRKVMGRRDYSVFQQLPTECFNKPYIKYCNLSLNEIFNAIAMDSDQTVARIKPLDKA